MGVEEIMFQDIIIKGLIECAESFNNGKEPEILHDVLFTTYQDFSNLFTCGHTVEWLEEYLLKRISNTDNRIYAIYCLAKQYGIDIDEIQTPGSIGAWLKSTLKIETYKNNHSIAEANPPEAEQKQVEQKQGQKVIPPEFQTPEAKQVFQWLIEKGIVDEEYLPTDKVKTKNGKIYLAQRINTEAGMIKNYGDRKLYQWKPFESLWGLKGMANDYQHLPCYSEEFEIVDNAFMKKDR